MMSVLLMSQLMLNEALMKLLKRTLKFTLPVRGWQDGSAVTVLAEDLSLSSNTLPGSQCLALGESQASVGTSTHVYIPTHIIKDKSF